MTEISEHRMAARRAELLEAAEQVFGAKGYADATVDDVAMAAGVSKGTMYNYFRSKEELFQQLLEAKCAKDEARVDEILARSTSFREKLQGFLDAWFDMSKHWIEHGRLILGIWAAAADGADGGASQAVQALFTRVHGRVATMLAEGQAAGEFDLDAPPDVSARLLLAILHGLQLQVLTGMMGDVDSAMFDALKAGLLQALTSNAPQSASAEGVSDA